MELKGHHDGHQAPRRPVSIAPLWNWKSGGYCNGITCLASFNRTFMELKDMLTGAERAKLIVSIAPLWNWKAWSRLWKGRKRQFQSHPYGIESCNRQKDTRTNSVSIAPLWNWKSGRFHYKQHLTTFQSHLYGIESLTLIHDLLPVHCFNRTFMELKVKRKFIALCFLASFNRTFMELKVRFMLRAFSWATTFQSHLYGIESFQQDQNEHHI